MKRLVMVVALVACGKTETNKLPNEAWGTADYATAGLRIDAPWTADDYTNAADVLARVTADHRDRLPRFHGAKSGAVFARLVSEVPDDPAQPISARFVAQVTHFGALDKIAKLYLPNKLDTPPREWIELYGTEMHDAVAIAGMSDAFVASFGPDDPSHQTRLDGLAQMRSGYGLMLVGGVYVADQKRVPDADRIALLGYITASLPSLYPHLEPDTQHQLHELLGKQATGFPAGPLRDAAVAAQHALPP